MTTSTTQMKLQQSWANARKVVMLSINHYPLVNVYIPMENPPMLLMGKLTISTGLSSSSQTVNIYQAGFFGL